MKIPYKKLLSDIPSPRCAHVYDAGVDLYATEGITLHPGESYMMGSGIAVAIPEGFVGLLFARSGLGSKGLVLKHGTGVIDSGYRGEIGLPLFNNNPSWDTEGTITINEGDRVAQLVIVPIVYPYFVEVDELDNTERGQNGFGSTGRS